LIYSTYWPNVIECPNGPGSGERMYDLPSRLLKERIILLNSAIDDQVSASIVAQLLFLTSDNPEKDISMYINSPGGVVTAGLAIYDTMQHIKPAVSTICIGQAASMGSVLLAGGNKGKRYSLPSSRIMIHQPSGGMQGQASDMRIQVKEIDRLQQDLYLKLSRDTGKTYEEIEKDCERDYFMSAEESKEYGLIDMVIQSS